MIEQISSYVHGIFAPYKGIESANELRDELIQNLSEKYNDYKQQGFTDEESYNCTIDSIGDVSELVESIDPYHNEHKERMYGSFSNGIMAVAVYVMLFVALMIAFNGTITRDTLVVPAVAFIVVISIMQFVVKGNSRFPRWLVLGSFITSTVTAVVMTIKFH